MDIKNILAKFDAVANSTGAKTVADTKQASAMTTILESLDRIAEGSKPDFLDLDKDGDKEESMAKAAKDKEDAKESVEEGAVLSPTYINHLKLKYKDKETLSPNEKHEVEGILKTKSIENIKTLMSADIPHVSQMAKLYLRNKTPGGMNKYNESEVQSSDVELEEAIMVSAEGSEAEALLQILKLSGMPTPAALPAPAADLDTMDIEMQDEYSNSPDEFEQDVDAVIANGTDLHREKGQYPATAPGDNPMNAFEGKFKSILADLLKE